MQAHLGSHNKGYVHYGARKRHRHPIVFPKAARVTEMQREGRDEACPAETHEWHLVFRQTAPFDFDAADDWAQARRLNADHPEADNYSILNTLESFRGRGDDDDDTMAFTLKLEYPNDPYAFAYRKNGDAFQKAKYQENLRVWRQTNDPTAVATCINDGGRARGEGKGVDTMVEGLCGVDDFENLFPTEWVPLAGKWGGLEYNGGGRAFISGESYRRFGLSSVGTGGAHWSVGSAQRDGPLAGDDNGVEVVELYACKKITDEAENEANTNNGDNGEEGSNNGNNDGSDGNSSEATDGGSWQLVFRQTAPFTFSRNGGWANALSLNAHDNTWPNFSTLDSLESFRSDDTGAFRFKLRYPTIGKENVWVQTNNPAAVATCKNNKGKPKTGNCGADGFVPESTDIPSEAEWGGLEYNGDKALMGGVGSRTRDALYQLGARKVARNAEGMKVFPTYAQVGDETRVELYVWTAAAAETTA